MQSITRLTLDPLDSAGGHLIDKDLKLGNFRAGANELAEEFAGFAGSEDIFQLRSNPVFAYVRNGFDGGTMDEPNADAYLRIFVTKTQLLMLGLWLVKDNSANPWRAFLRVFDSEGPHFRTESFTTHFYMADCELRTVHFTQDELNRAIAFYLQFFEVIPQLPENQSYLSGLAFGTRLSRALYFVEAARNTSDLLIKLSFYCMCLESLFTTGSGRYSHNVPKHASCMLGRTRRERQQAYADIYAMYGYRSDVVHGASFEPAELAAIRDSVQRSDGYIRRIITEVLTNAHLLHLFQHATKKELDRHLNGGSK